MFGTFLWYFYGSVAERKDFFTDTFDFVTHNERHFLFYLEVLQHYTPFHLFYGVYFISHCFQLSACSLRRFKITPWHRLIRAQGRLVNLAMWRTCRDTTEKHLPYSECISRTKYGTHIAQRTNIVQNHHHRQFFYICIRLF